MVRGVGALLSGEGLPLELCRAVRRHLVAKSTPPAEGAESGEPPVAKVRMSDVFPTPLSPMSTHLNW